MRHALFRHHDLLSRLGITSDAWRPARQGKTSKAADRDALACLEGLGHGIENGFDSVVRAAHCQLWVARGETGNQFRLGHWNFARRGNRSRNAAGRLAAPRNVTLRDLVVTL